MRVSSKTAYKGTIPHRVSIESTALFRAVADARVEVDGTDRSPEWPETAFWPWEAMSDGGTEHRYAAHAQACGDQHYSATRVGIDPAAFDRADGRIGPTVRAAVLRARRRHPAGRGAATDCSQQHALGELAAPFPQVGMHSAMR